MNWTISTLAQSLADYLAPKFTGVTFFEDPNQQGTTVPAMFLQTRYARIKPATNGRVFRTLGLDLTYLEDYNLPDMQRKYQSAMETLDLCMETFPYSDLTEKPIKTTLVRTYEREANIDLDALHYKFELRFYLYPEEDAVLMQTLEPNVEVV